MTTYANTCIFKAALSAGTLTGVKYAYGEKLNKDALVPAGYQFVSSYLASDVEGYLRPLLPPQLQLQSMYFKPIVVGGLYSIMANLLSSDKSYMMNFLISAGSEMGAKILEPALSGFGPNSLAPARTTSMMPPASNSLARTLG